MKILLRQATVVNPKSKFHGQKLDIEIINGIITKIDDNIEPNGHHIVASNNLHVSAGWVDTFANFCDPGYEHRETLESVMLFSAK